jgi:hypothetical protein
MLSAFSANECRDRHQGTTKTKPHKTKIASIPWYTYLRHSGAGIQTY